MRFAIFCSIMYVAGVFIWGVAGIADSVKSNMVYLGDFTDYMPARLKEVKQKSNVDILFVGSSHAYRGFNPEYFSRKGYNAFNLGSSAQTPIQTNLLLERYLRSLNPRLVIYEVYPVVFGSDGIESAVNIIASEKNDLASIRMAAETKNMKVYNSLLYSCITDMLGIQQKDVVGGTVGIDRYMGNGYVERITTHNSSRSYPATFVDFKARQLEKFESSLELISSIGSDIILVYAPITKSYYHSFGNNSSVDSLMNTYGEYYNFNDTMDLDDSVHFFDAHHLNNEGVKRFNKVLLELLEKRGIKKP